MNINESILEESATEWFKELKYQYKFGLCILQDWLGKWFNIISKS